jgi:hypothetical protein
MNGETAYTFFPGTVGFDRLGRIAPGGDKVAAKGLGLKNASLAKCILVPRVTRWIEIRATILPYLHNDDSGDTMLAEMFMLRLEAIARPSQERILSFARFVPVNPAAPIELKNGSRDRRS